MSRLYSPARQARSCSGVTTNGFDLELMLQPGGLGFTASEIWERLHADEVEGEELYEAMSHHFGQAQSDGRGLVGFPDLSNARMRLLIADDKVSAIEPGPNYAEADTEALEEAVTKTLIDDQVPSVAANIAFATRPTMGSFGAPEDAFQIVPAPAEAPRPPAIVGQHPFVLEFSVVTSPDSFVTLSRRSRAFAKWVWFLNATLTDQITAIGNRARQVWVICPDWGSDEWSPPKTTWGQEYYGVEGFNGLPGEFSIGHDPIVPIADDVYYARRGLTVGETLVVPSTFADTVARFLHLRDSSREKFLQAAQWRAAANGLWNIQSRPGISRRWCE